MRNVRKILASVAEELGETVCQSHKIIDLRKLILGSENYEEELVKAMIEQITEEGERGKDNEEREREGTKGKR